MALYSMYLQSSPQVTYEESQRARHQALQSQLGYYPEQHDDVHQPQAIEYTDGTTGYSRSYPTEYDPAAFGYSVPLPSYEPGLATRDDLHHDFPYPNSIQSGHLPGISDDTDTTSRPRLTAEQTRELESLYAANSKPSTQQKQEYASRFRLTKNRVDNWFQNRRAKSKNQSKTKHTEIILSDRTKLGSRPVTRDVPSHQDYSPYQYSETTPSHNASLDLLASVNYANDQGGHLTPQNIYASPQQILWNSQQEENPRQNLVAFNEYSHINTFPNKQVSECGSRASLSPVSPTAFHPVTATCHQHTHLAAEYPSEAFTRRGSVLSDLVSHMDGIQLPSSSSSPTTHTPTNDMFVIEPRRGFGERRPQRPAALGPMRSTSSGATLTSPLLTDSTMSRSLRRVNTCGIPLNRSNRIQKHSLITTPQRSPTILSQAFERAMEQQQQQQYTPHILSQAVSPEAIDNFEEEKETIESDVVFNVNPPSVELTWNESRRGEFSVPPLSASLTGDDGSPPHTPLPGQESLVVPWSGQEMYPMTSNSVSSFTAHPSPTYIQEQARCFPSSSSDNSIPQYWEGTNTSDMFLAPRSFEADDPALAQIPRQDSPSSHYPSYSTMSRRNEALKIEFSHPHQEVRSQYYVPLRENQNYVFHEYNPDNARRGE